MFPFVAFASDRGALELLYDALSGDRWDNADGWLSEAPLYEWHGVTTRDGRVIRIELPDNNLTGQLPLGLEDLDELEVLDLRWNNIWGSIPESFGEIASLESLLLSGNELSGEIPWSVGSIQTLKRLDLSNNQLWGDIPSTLGELQSLESLGLQHNQLTGAVPQALAQVGSLRRLILNNNSLTGIVPSGFGQMSPGMHVRIDNNPTRFENFANLDSLSLEGTDIPSMGQISGRDLLDETTIVLGDNQAAEFVRATMSAISVRDGFLSIESEKLPQNANVEQLEEVIDAVNDGLRESGDRIRSVNDLERIFELYEGPRLQIPDMESNSPAESNSPTFEAMNPLSSAGNSFGHDFGSSTGSSVGVSAKQSSLNMAGGGAGVTKQVREPAGINCPGTKANEPHSSVYRDGYIHGKARVKCAYAFGPAQTITYKPESRLQSMRQFFTYTFWVNVGEPKKVTESGDPIDIHHNRLIANVPCGLGVYRTRLSLYITGSVSGRFYPYPGRYYSARRILDCND